MEVRHEHGRLTAAPAKHVDDIKIGGERRVIKDNIIAPLEKAFGNLTYHEKDFTNTGVHHVMLDGRFGGARPR